MMEHIEAPFTTEQVENLNRYQLSGRFHPFTCMSPEEIPECLRAKAARDEDEQFEKALADAGLTFDEAVEKGMLTEIASRVSVESTLESEGLLKATTEGWVCPCGKRPIQKWAHAFMAEPQSTT